jgi:hypothetical protein
VDALALATLLLVAATMLVALAAFRQATLAKNALELSIRPLLADPEPVTSEQEVEWTTFGPPGRDSIRLGVGVFFYREDGGLVSFPFRNIGSGAAVITNATTEPAINGSVYVARKFVPQGEHVRVNISRTPEGDHQSMPLAVLIHYTDAAGRQAMISRADVQQAATQGPWIETISVFKKGHFKPFAVGRSTI